MHSKTIHFLEKFSECGLFKLHQAPQSTEQMLSEAQHCIELGEILANAPEVSVEEQMNIQILVAGARYLRNLAQGIKKGTQHKIYGGSPQIALLNTLTSPPFDTHAMHLLEVINYFHNCLEEVNLLQQQPHVTPQYHAIKYNAPSIRTSKTNTTLDLPPQPNRFRLN